MSDLIYDDPGTPLFWELMAKYGPKFLETPWSPEFLEIEPEPTDDEAKIRNWPVTFDGAVEYAKRIVASRYDTRQMPILALDQYAQHVDLTAQEIEEVIQGVLVDG